MATAMSSRRRLLDPPTRLRTMRAKALVLAGAAAAFAGAFGLTRASHPGKPKHPPKALHAPDAFVRQVQQDAQLRGGLVAPPQAPPEAQTGTS